MKKNDIYILDALRTPMARPNSKFASIDVAGLAEALMRGLVHRNSFLKKSISQVVIGTAVPAGAGQNFIRKAIIAAGLPPATPGYLVGNVCASGLQAVIGAGQSILCGDAEVVLAGGAESVTHMPQLIFAQGYDAKKARGLNESLMNDGLMCSVTDRSMGVLCEGIAKQAKISRQEQDDYAFESYCRASRAQAAGLFEEEILAISLPGKKTVVADETIRKNIARSGFDRFAGAFEKKGTITAANSASPCDGAAMVIACSPEAMKRFGARPMARIVEYVSIAGDPAAAFTLAGAAVEALLKKAKRCIEDIDIFEISEAFAAQMVFTQRALQISSIQINPHGGDIALGHPLGAAGARVLVTLIHTLRREQKQLGVACACLGGGGAVAILVERC